MAVSRKRPRKNSWWLIAISLLASPSCALFVHRKGAQQSHNGRSLLSLQGSVSAEESSKATSEHLAFRAPTLNDVEPISDLLVECFETELKWFEFPERETRRKRYRDMLQSSFVRRINNANAEAFTTSENDVANNDKANNSVDLSFMLLVEAKENLQNKIVGFVQLGLLPLPPGFPTEEDGTDVDDVDTAPSTEQQPTMWNGVPVELPQQAAAAAAKDVPYIANLCVLPSCRKSGIGKKMVDICLRWLDKRQPKTNNHVFIAVDSDNVVAKRFYERIGFVLIGLPGNASDEEEATTAIPSKRDYLFRSISSNY